LERTTGKIPKIRNYDHKVEKINNKIVFVLKILDENGYQTLRYFNLKFRINLCVFTPLVFKIDENCTESDPLNLDANSPDLNQGRSPSELSRLSEQLDYSNIDHTIQEIMISTQTNTIKRDRSTWL